MNTNNFINLLRTIPLTNLWKTYIGKSCHDRKCILLRHEGSEMIFSPLSAVYFTLSGREVHRGSFWFEEITREYGMPWWEVLEISYATTGCSGGGRNYNGELRNQILQALNLSLEK